MTMSLNPESTKGDRPAVDMSPEAIDQRLLDASDLWDLWARLEIDRNDGKLVVAGGMPKE